MKNLKRNHRSPGPSSRDLGLDSNQAGKGDAPRNCFSDDYKENFSAISGFGSAAGFTQKKNGRQVKVYGVQRRLAEITYCPVEPEIP